MPLISRREFAGLVAAAGAPARRLRGATVSAAALDDTLRAGIARRRIPAAAAMVAGERTVLYSGAFGTRDSSGAPVAADSIFAIASMTKAITTTAALQLVEQGKEWSAAKCREVSNRAGHCCSRRLRFPKVEDRQGVGCSAAVLIGQCISGT